MSPSIYRPVNPGIGEPRDGHRFVVWIVVLVAALSLIGCAGLQQQASPRAQWAEASIAYADALDQATALQRAGRLNAGDAQAIESQRQHARDGLDQADLILRSTTRSPDEATRWLDRARAALAEIARILSKYQGLPQQEKSA